MTRTAWEAVGGWLHLWGTRCNSWQCPACGPLRTWVLCKRLADAEPNRLITLTCGRPAGREPEEVWQDTRRQVPELIRKIRKEVGEIEYARVLEVHKSGYPHFHLVVRSPFIEQELLSRWWCDLTDAFIVDIRKVNSKKEVAKYLGKYLTKQLRIPFTRRRVSASRGFFRRTDAVPSEPRQWMCEEKFRGGLPRYISEHGLAGRVMMLSQSHGVLLNGNDEVLSEFVDTESHSEVDLIDSYYGYHDEP